MSEPFVFDGVQRERVCLDAMLTILSEVLPDYLDRIRQDWLQLASPPGTVLARRDPYAQLKAAARLDRTAVDVSELWSIRNRFAHWAEIDESYVRAALRCARRYLSRIGEWDQANRLLGCYEIVGSGTSAAVAPPAPKPLSKRVVGRLLSASERDACRDVFAAADDRAASGRQGAIFELVYDDRYDPDRVLECIATELRERGRITLGLSGSALGLGDGSTSIVGGVADLLASAVEKYRRPGILMTSRWAEQLRGAAAGPPSRLVYAIDEIEEAGNRLAIIVEGLDAVGDTAWNNLWSVLQSIICDTTTIIVLAVHRNRRGVPDPPGATFEISGPTRRDVEGFVRRGLSGWNDAAADAMAEMIADEAEDLTLVRMLTKRAGDPAYRDLPIGTLRQRLHAVLPEPLSVESAGRCIDEAAARITHATGAVSIFGWLVVVDQVSGPDMIADTFAHIDDGAAIEFYEWLRDSRFVRIDGDATEWSPIRLKDLIRHGAETALRRESPQALAECHALAEAYYRSRIALDREIDASDAWAAWNQFERPDFQHDCHRWLHHAATTGSPVSAATRNAMIELFLQTFWWWGGSVPTDFTLALLEGYDELRSGPRTAHSGTGGCRFEWIDELRRFRESYVSGWEHRHPAGDGAQRWQEAARAISDLQDMIGLDDDSIPEEQSLRRIKVLCRCLLAAAIWLGGAGGKVDAEDALASYRVARKCGEQDPWLQAWIDFYCADIWSYIDPAEARTILGVLDDEVALLGENELRAHLSRLHADLAWHDGNPALALDLQVRAVLHAYVYHVRQEREMAPSEYTRNLYVYVTGAAESRFREAEAVDVEIATAARLRCRTVFAPWWDQWSVQTDEDTGPRIGEFPPPPAAGELGLLHSRYTKAVRWTIEHLSDELERPSFKPLPQL